MEQILLAVIFRKAEEADMPGLMNIEEDCFGAERFRPEVVRAFLMRDKAFIVACVEEGGIVGSAMAMYSEEVGEGKIASIAVMRRMRGQGIGAQLLEECENVFRAHGLKRYSLEVETSNEPAVSLYKTRGYRTVGVIDDFYGAGRHAYCMQKRVGDSKGVKLTPS
jgi:ribosomal-protein-alanine N-acetyltransferase